MRKRPINQKHAEYQKEEHEHHEARDSRPQSACHGAHHRNHFSGTVKPTDDNHNSE
eukprot:CAMPEP_0180564038 /NCGR_PEP_ID=MMETSP1037_2-20121125/4800_1 /TAXON_ID=632150 /ORGANISM="Azadinium spinosum, Strain 3D9" /LENGTH=55 /DNA_ID=CAMNT_0022580917 /DNA_START=121 /DNA_END=288 /DNA_ORIENTATION=+